MLLLILLALFSLQAEAQEQIKNGGFHLCYFSLNNQKEFTKMDEFTQKLNAKSKIKITVSEYLTEGDSPSEAFQAMIESGVRCDGLVISGHHTGSFGGERASGSLEISFLEELSCEKNFKDWFSGINALWLQGCRTLGVGKIETAEEEVPLYDPDYHTQRVGAALDEDNLEQSFSDLNMEFSATLDQDNPLSERYLRLFPKAKVFGWTKTAPGINAKSENSIPFHIAHTAKLLENEPLEDPLQENLSKTQVKSYVDTLSILLSDLGKIAVNCEEMGIEGWLHQGQKYGPEPYSLENPDLQAYQKLSSSNSEFMHDLKVKECALRAAKTKEEKLKAIAALTENEQIIQHGFSTIWERLQGEEDPETLEAIRTALKNSPRVISFLEKKLFSKQLGLLRKIDYYGFYKDLVGLKNEKVEDLIFQVALKQLDVPVEETDYALQDYRTTLLQSISKNGFITEDRAKLLIDLKNRNSSDYYRILLGLDFSSNKAGAVNRVIEKIMSSPNLDAFAMRSVADVIKDSNKNIFDADKILEKIIDSEKSNAGNFLDVAEAIVYSKSSIPNSHILFEKMLNAKKGLNQYSLQAIATAIGQSNVPIQGADKLLEKIIDMNINGDKPLGAVAQAIFISNFPIPNASGLLEKILSSKKFDKKAMDMIIASMASFSRTYKDMDSGKILERIVDSENADKNILSKVADVLRLSNTPISNAGTILEKILSKNDGTSMIPQMLISTIVYSHTEIPNATELLNKITDSKDSNAFILSEVTRALWESNFPIKNPEIILEKILKSEQCDVDSFRGVAETIEKSKTPISGAEIFLEQVISHSTKDDDTLISVANAIHKSKFVIPNAEKIIEKVINSENRSGMGLTIAGQAIVNSKSPMPNAEANLEKIIEAKEANSLTLDWITSAILGSNTPLPYEKRILEKVLNSKKFDYQLAETFDKGLKKSSSPNKEFFLKLLAAKKKQLHENRHD